MAVAVEKKDVATKARQRRSLVHNDLGILEVTGQVIEKHRKVNKEEAIFEGRGELVFLMLVFRCWWK